MKILIIGLILLVVKRTALSGGSLVKKITAVRGSDVWIECMFDAARMRQDEPVWWLHCENSNCIEIQHLIGGVDQLQDRAASRRGRVYPDKLREGNASLFIENVQMSDEGHYECSAILRERPDTKISVLTVLASYEPPQLTEALDTRAFTCSSRNGFPPALVTWTGGSGMNYTPDSVTQHTLNPEGLYDVVSKLTRNVTEEETICCTVWNQPLQEHKTNCMRVTPGEETDDQHLLTATLILVALFILACVGFMIYRYLSKGRRNPANDRIRKRISSCSNHAVIVLIGRPRHGMPSLINSCVFAYKAEKHFENLAGADKEPPYYAQPEEVPLSERITITRALLQQEDRFWTDERDSYLDKWRKQVQSQRCRFVFVHRQDLLQTFSRWLLQTVPSTTPFTIHKTFSIWLSRKLLDNYRNGSTRKDFNCINKLTETTKDEIQKLFEDVKSVTGSYPFTALTMKTFGDGDELKPFFKYLGSKQVFSFHNYTIHNHKRTAQRDKDCLDFMIACIDEALVPESEMVPLVEDV